jgi:hypothetical protein
MAVSQFADMSKELYTQIRVVEDLVRGELFKEARKALTTCESACNNLESVMMPDNKIQSDIIRNRRREIGWIEDAIQAGLAKTKPAAKKRVVKAKTK